MFGAALTGSTGLADQTAAIGQPENVFWGSAVLPGDLRRVLVLPLACDASAADLSEGCTALNPVLLAELGKIEKFEVIPADPETLRRLTGRLTWTGSEILTADFFDSLRRAYGCDAVLFCQLTVYRAYPPLAVGWRLKLVGDRTGQILWAADEVFHAAAPDTPDAAYDFDFPQLPLFHSASERWLRENSPRQFGQNTLAGLLTTLPYRQNIAKVITPPADVRGGRWSKTHR